jgi:hypothetical protein
MKASSLPPRKSVLINLIEHGLTQLFGVHQRKLRPSGNSASPGYSQLQIITGQVVDKLQLSAICCEPGRIPAGQCRDQANLGFRRMRQAGSHFGQFELQNFSLSGCRNGITCSPSSPVGAHQTSKAHHLRAADRALCNHIVQPGLLERKRHRVNMLEIDLRHCDRQIPVAFHPPSAHSSELWRFTTNIFRKVQIQINRLIHVIQDVPCAFIKCVKPIWVRSIRTPLSGVVETMLNAMNSMAPVIRRRKVKTIPVFHQSAFFFIFKIKTLADSQKITSTK